MACALLSSLSAPSGHQATAAVLDRTRSCRPARKSNGLARSTTAADAANLDDGARARARAFPGCPTTFSCDLARVPTRGCASPLAGMRLLLSPPAREDVPAALCSFAHAPACSRRRALEACTAARTPRARRAMHATRRARGGRRARAYRRRSRRFGADAASGTRCTARVSRRRSSSTTTTARPVQDGEAGLREARRLEGVGGRPVDAGAPPRLGHPAGRCSCSAAGARELEVDMLCGAEDAVLATSPRVQVGCRARVPPRVVESST